MGIKLLITSGNGPDECCLFVKKFYDYLCFEAQKRNGFITLVKEIKGKKRDTFRSLQVNISHCDRTLIDNVLGTHLWKIESMYRDDAERSNWYIEVKNYEEETIIPSVWEENYKIETMRASGSGGQHINKNDTAVRVTHLSTGITAVAQERRSQSQNKKLAFERIKSKLENIAREEIKSNRKAQWKSRKSINRGSANLVFKGEKFRLIRGKL